MFIIGEITTVSDFLGKQHFTALEDRRKVTTSGRSCGTDNVLPTTGPVIQPKAEETAKSLWIKISKWWLAGMNNSQVQRDSTALCHCLLTVFYSLLVTHKVMMWLIVTKKLELIKYNIIGT